MLIIIIKRKKVNGNKNTNIKKSRKNKIVEILDKSKSYNLFKSQNSSKNTSITKESNFLISNTRIGFTK